MRDSDPGAPVPGTRSGRSLRRFIRVILLLLLLGLFGMAVFEAETSHFQSRYFASVASRMTFHVEPGGSSQIFFPTYGPSDERLGYVDIGVLADTLQKQGFRVTSQARSSEEMLAWAERGIGPVYIEKAQTGLDVIDRSGRQLYSSRYPERVFTSFDSIPRVIVESLLFIENRELLQTRYPYRNPAVEWDRLAKAALEELLRRVQPERNVAGGSTLATQIEKYRHSPGGWTATPQDKLRQMAAASLRAYQKGRDTSRARRDILLDYMNSIPLAAAPGYGEVSGLGDGLWAWYGVDLEVVARLLRDESGRPAATDSSAGGVRDAAAAPVDPTIGAVSVGSLQERAVAYRQTLSLLLAQRRPTYYLLQDRADLAALTDSYLRILAKEGVIGTELRDAALSAETIASIDMGWTRNSSAGREAGVSTPVAANGGALARPGQGSTGRGRRRVPSPVSPAETKAAVSIRSLLVSLLDRNDLYELDRLDLRVTASIDSAAQGSIVRLFEQLKDADFAREAKLLEPRMLRPDDLESVVYSFTLYERVPGGNLLRVQADNYPGALNLNESARLELGSTAKLRTLANYLQLIAELHEKYSAMPVQDLRAVTVHPRDPLTRWVIGYLSSRPGATVEEILNAAMERAYSANPEEGFFTGGGLHHFANFDDKHDDRVMSVREGFRHSVNLVFIRLMRDIVYHYTYRGSGPAGRFLEDTGDTLRQVYLEKFADREGSEFLRRFYKTYRDLSPSERITEFFEGVRKTPRALAAAFRAIQPEAGVVELGTFLRTRLPNAALSDRSVQGLYEEFAPGKVPLEDQGYVARVHPLELWLMTYLTEHPEASLQEILDQSAGERRDVYTWLYRTKRRNAQDVRIRVLLEVEAFLEIQRAWARFGYPFESLVPSYATSIGSSGDRAAALADLVGIIVGGGVRQPNMRVLDLSFAEGTPYETNLQRVPQKGEQVMHPAVAATLRQELIGVVESGTARRAFEAVTLVDGAVLPVGGKTGTGDNRIKVFGTSGQLVESKVMNRTASFVFIVGDRFYGTIVAYVPGAQAERYAFTSALPVQIFATLAPSLDPLFSAPPARAFAEELLSDSKVEIPDDGTGNGPESATVDADSTGPVPDYGASSNDSLPGADSSRTPAGAGL